MIHAAPILLATGAAGLTALLTRKKKPSTGAASAPGGVSPAQSVPDSASDYPPVPGASAALPAVPVSAAANVPGGGPVLAQATPAIKPGAPTQAEVVAALVSGDDSLVRTLQSRGLTAEARAIDDAQDYLARAIDIAAPTPVTAPPAAAVKTATPTTKAADQSKPKASAAKPAPVKSAPKPAAKPAPVKSAPKPAPKTPLQLAAARVDRDPTNKAQVAEFQSLAGLKADGLYGPMTARAVWDANGYAPIPTVYPKADWNGAKTRGEWRSYILSKRPGASSAVRAMIDEDLKAL